jgi:hypothetical protein
MRGRSNRKGPNPLTRSYESNGPDVKIRGTAQHVAEKYLQLARDAQSSGDTIMAENLLQHAEHYFRLIAAAQTAQQGYGRSYEAETETVEEDDDLVVVPDRFAPLSERLPQPAAYQPQQPYQGQPYSPQGGQPQPHFAPQPHFSQQPQPYEERPIGERPTNEQRDRQPRNFRDRRDRGGDRNGEGGFDRNRDNRRFQPRGESAAQEAPIRQEPIRQEPIREVAGPSALPSFITGPTRASNAEAETGEASFARSERAVSRDHEEAASGYHLSTRRRRRPRAGGEEANGVAAGDEPPAHSSELPLGD